MYLKKKKIRRFSKINRVELVFCVVHNCFTPITFRWSDSTRTLPLASETLLARAPQMKTRFKPPSLMKIRSWSRLESWKLMASWRREDLRNNIHLHRKKTKISSPLSDEDASSSPAKIVKRGIFVFLRDRFQERIQEKWRDLGGKWRFQTNKDTQKINLSLQL